MVGILSIAYIRRGTLLLHVQSVGEGDVGCKAGLHISTAPAVAPANMERIALGY
jgi:hypothetical protein